MMSHKKEETFSRISFWKIYQNEDGQEKRIVKQVVLPEGILLPAEILPVETEQSKEQIRGWKLRGESKDIVYTEQNVGTLKAVGNLEFEAVYREKDKNKTVSDPLS